MTGFPRIPLALSGEHGKYETNLDSSLEKKKKKKKKKVQLALRLV